ncbi:FAD-binding oxidoreductase [Rhodobacteraceae bacterium NNCM2]|nr:FAD-binding oxidoreductase [Coraliihabitans acroporae]
MAEQKIAVIGAGIIGASIALHLARRGAAVTVVEAGEPGSGATSGSFAWINAHDVKKPDYFQTRLRSIALWHRLVADHPGLAVRFTGCLDWELSVGEMIDQIAVQSALGHPARLVGQEEIEELFPGMTAPEAGIWTEGDGLTDPDMIAQQFLSIAAEVGATLVRGKVTGIDAGGRALRLGDERLEVDHTVVAAGLGSVELLSHLGVELPLAPSPGLILRTNPLPPLTRSVIASPDVHCWQLDDGRLIAGADYGGTFAEGEAEETAAAIAKALMALFPKAGEVRVEETRVTNRPIPGDGLPILGPVPGNAALSVAVMHSGVTLAPVVGEMIAASILGGDTGDLGAYTLGRFSG